MVSNHSGSEKTSAHVSGQANRPLTKPAHALSYEAVVSEIKANADDGLTEQEAQRRLDKFGPNELGSDDGVQLLKILARQVANAMTLVGLLDQVTAKGRKVNPTSRF